MKTHTLFLCLLLAFLGASSQHPYSNNWFVNAPNRPFVKLLVTQDAVYQLQVSELLSAGHDLSQASPDSIQIYYRGGEIPLSVNVDAQGHFAYLTFYGKRNDGAIESKMYRNPITGVFDPNQQPNLNFSLYSDTSAYFLTWGNQKGLRYQTYMDSNYAQYTPALSYPYEMSWEPHPDSARSTSQNAQALVGGGGPYNLRHKLNSDFITGEGYVSEKSFHPRERWSTNFLETPDPISSSQQVRFTIRLFHASKTSHHIKVSLANNPSTVILDTLYPHRIIRVKSYQRDVQLSLTSQADLLFESQKGWEETDNNHLCSIRIRYERKTDLAHQTSTQISEWPSNASTYFRFANAQGQDKVWVYDPDNQIRYEGEISQGEAHIILGGRFYGKKLELVTDQGFQRPLISPKTSFRNLCHPDSGAEFVIISHRKVDTTAYTYAAYRDTNRAGVGPLSTKVVFVDEIYEEFSFGVPTPQAIQQFVNCALDNWLQKPKYIFLWGKGRTWIRGNMDYSLVPAYGYPASDVRFTTALEGEKKSRLPIGRLNIYNNQEGRAYLEKVQKFERLGEEPWRKEGVFLGSGQDSAQINFIRKEIRSHAGCFASTFSGDTLVYNREEIQTIPGSNYHDKINDGVAMLSTWGYPPPFWVETPIFEAFEYQNFDKASFMLWLGAFGGDWSGRESFGERWIKEPNRGAIALLANSSYGYPTYLEPFGQIFFCQELSRKPNRSIGQIVRRSYNKMIDSFPDFQYRNLARQMNLQGDPSLVIFPFGMNVGIDPIPELGVHVYPNPTIGRTDNCF